MASFVAARIVPHRHPPLEPQGPGKVLCTVLASSIRDMSGHFDGLLNPDMGSTRRTAKWTIATGNRIRYPIVNLSEVPVHQTVVSCLHRANATYTGARADMTSQEH